MIVGKENHSENFNSQSMHYNRSLKCSYKGLIIEYYKAKAIPLQAWTDPVGSRSLRLPDFKTIGT